VKSEFREWAERCWCGPTNVSGPAAWRFSRKRKLAGSHWHDIAILLTRCGAGPRPSQRPNSVISEQEQPSNMDIAIHVDEAACRGCQDITALTNMVHPKGSDWRGLLGVEGDCERVCGKCSRKINVMRKSARRKATDPSRVLSPNEVAVLATGFRSRNQGWGTASSTRRCDAVRYVSDHWSQRSCTGTA